MTSMSMRISMVKIEKLELKVQTRMTRKIGLTS